MINIILQISEAMCSGVCCLSQFSKRQERGGKVANVNLGRFFWGTIEDQREPCVAHAAISSAGS